MQQRRGSERSREMQIIDASKTLQQQQISQANQIRDGNREPNARFFTRRGSERSREMQQRLCNRSEFHRRIKSEMLTEKQTLGFLRDEEVRGAQRERSQGFQMHNPRFLEMQLQWIRSSDEEVRGPEREIERPGKRDGSKLLCYVRHSSTPLL